MSTKFSIKVFLKNRKVKNFVKWRTNNLMAFFLSIKKSGIKYNEDILILILTFLNLENITHPDVKDIEKCESHINYCQSPYVILKLNMYINLRWVKTIVSKNLHTLIFKDMNFIKVFLRDYGCYKYINYIDKDIFKNRDNVIELIPIFSKNMLYEYIPEELKFDRGIIFKILMYRKYSEKYLRAIFSKFGKDKNMIEEILKRRPELYPKASRSFRRDKNILIMCVTKYPNNMNHLPEKYRHDFDLMKKIYSINKSCGVYMSSNLIF
jgi:hypothetical protein